VSEVPDFNDVRGLLEAAMARRGDDESAWAERESVSWGHALRWASPHRPDGFDPYQGAVRSGKIVRGQPAQGEDAKTLVGFDAEDRVVVVRSLDGGRVVREAVIHHEPQSSIGITLMTQGSGEWGPESAYVDEYRDGTIWRTSGLGKHTSGINQTEFVYDGDGRLIEEIERRERRFDAGGHEQRRTMLYGDDGKPETLLAGASVVWRRRAKSVEVKNAAAGAEDALVRALATGLRRGFDLEGPLVVWLRHQDDGSWVDQAMPEVSVTTLDPSSRPWAEQWEFESWATPSLEYETDAVAAALDRLDETCTPAEREARRLLIRVATRLRGVPEFPGGEPATIVTGYDPPSLNRQIESSAGAPTVLRLRAAGWLPDSP
jgi:YD repeat-containing protein